MPTFSGLAEKLANFKIKKFAFLISLDGHEEITQAGFQEVIGLGVGIPPFAIPEPGSAHDFQFPNKVENKPLTLVRGVDFFGALFKWIKDVEGWRPGRPDYRKHLSIYLMEHVVARTARAAGIGVSVDTAIAVRGWDIYNAWPTDWRLDDLNSNESGLAFERIQLIYESIEDAPLGTATISIDVPTLSF